MIERRDLYHLPFYEKEIFYGSFRGMHYRIARSEPEGSPVFSVTTWPGPYNYETTGDAKKTARTFPFTDEALDEIVSYLNALWERDYDSARKMTLE